MNKLNIPASRLPAKYVRIHDAFKELHRKISDIHCPLVLTGIGGMGKTSLSQDYYHNTHHTYQHKIWIPFQIDMSNSLTAHTRLIEKLNIPHFHTFKTQEEQLTHILQAIKALQGKKLLVIDALDKKIDDEEREFLLDLPAELHATILISSRNNLKGFDEMPMPTMSLQDAKIIYAVYRDNISVNTKKAHLIEWGFDMPNFSDAEIQLLQYAQYHPLLLELMAKTMNNDMSITPENLLQKFKNYAPILSTETVYSSRTKKAKSLQEQLKIIFEAQKLPEAQRDILREISLLPSVQIPYENLKVFIHKAERSDEQLQKNIQELINYGWLQRTDRNLQMHRAIQFTIDEQIPYKENKYFHVVYNINQITYKIMHINILQAQPFIIYEAHLIPLLLKNKDEKNAATSYSNLSLIYQSLGKLKKALAFQEKAIAIEEQILDNKHPHLATSYNNLSGIYQDVGKLEKALAFQEKAIAIREQILDNKHPSLASSYNNLSLIYQSLGKLEKALVFQEKAIAIEEQILDNKHPSLATSYSNLASIYQSLGKLEKALVFQEKAIAIREQILDNKHPHLATSYNNLSLIYQSLGKLEKALAFQVKAIAIKEQILDNKHPSLVTSYSNLSLIYQSLGKLEKALVFQEKAIAIREQILDNKHPDLASSYHNLSSMFIQLKDFKQALLYNEKAVAILQYSFPNGHPHLDIALEYQNHIKKYLGVL